MLGRRLLVVAVLVCAAWTVSAAEAGTDMPPEVIPVLQNAKPYDFVLSKKDNSSEQCSQTFVYHGLNSTSDPVYQFVLISDAGPGQNVELEVKADKCATGVDCVYSGYGFSYAKTAMIIASSDEVLFTITATSECLPIKMSIAGTRGEQSYPFPGGDGIITAESDDVSGFVLSFTPAVAPSLHCSDVEYGIFYRVMNNMSDPETVKSNFTTAAGVMEGTLFQEQFIISEPCDELLQLSLGFFDTKASYIFSVVVRARGERNNPQLLIYNPVIADVFTNGDAYAQELQVLLFIWVPLTVVCCLGLWWTVCRRARKKFNENKYDELGSSKASGSSGSSGTRSRAASRIEAPPRATEFKETPQDVPMQNLGRKKSKSKRKKSKSKKQSGLNESLLEQGAGTSDPAPAPAAPAGDIEAQDAPQQAVGVADDEITTL